MDDVPAPSSPPLIAGAPPVIGPEIAAECRGPAQGGPAGVPPVLASVEQPLNGGRAAVVLLGFIGAQFGAGIAVGLAGVVWTAAQGKVLHNSQQRAAMMQDLMAPATILAMLAGAAAMLGLSALLLRGGLGNRNPTGAAWARGSAKANAMGLAAGALTALGYVGLAALSLGAGGTSAPPGPIARMATTPGLSQVAWLILAVLLAPPIEELMFRGIFYGGCRRSLGPVWAAVLTTVVFVMLHVTETIHFLPALAGITALALVALWFRLRGAAIGPAVAVHFGYNAVIAIMAVHATAG